MKKLIFIILITFFMFTCGLTPSSTTIKNNSSFDISFKRSYEDKRIETLSPNTSTTLKGSYPIIVILQPEKRVKIDRYDRDIITLIDLPSWEVYAENKTNNPITLNAEGWMEEMNVPVGDFADLPSQKGIIFTNKPQFYVNADTFPYNIQWQFKNEIFFVCIK